MSNIKINFSQNCISTFNKDIKLYSYLYSILSHAYFKLSTNCLTFYLKDDPGLFSCVYPVDYDGKEIYFSIDYAKWVNALQKFSSSESGVNLEISDKKNSIKISTDNSSDEITLSISKFTKDSSIVAAIESGFDKGHSFKRDLRLELNDDIVEDLQLAGSLFNTQGNINSIGVSKDGVIYADKLIILTTKFKNSLDPKLFSGDLDNTEERYFYIHQFVLSLINFLYKEDPDIYFSNDYSSIFWHSATKELVITSEMRDLVLPSSEDLLNLYPDDSAGIIETDKDSLSESLDFFNGFYEGSPWKPITFTAVANKEIVLRYKRPEADLTKALNGTSDENSTFILSSDSLKKVISRVIDKRDDRSSPLPIEIRFDEEHAGVLFNIGDYCSAFLAKLTDDSEY